MNMGNLIGRLLAALGYTVVRSSRCPRRTLNLLDLADMALQARENRLLKVLQIGAFDGVSSDPLRKILETRRGIRAVLVEPQAVAFDALRARYDGIAGVALENAAICEHDGEAILYVPVGAPSSPKASMCPSHRFRFGGDRHVRPITVKAMTVKSLVDKHNCRDIDILQIDAEGYDYRILKQVFDSGIFPLVINMESWHLAKNEREVMYVAFDSHGYSYIDSGRDSFAIRLGELRADSHSLTR